jgi:hypothetical protein
MPQHGFGDDEPSGSGLLIPDSSRLGILYFPSGHSAFGDAGVEAAKRMRIGELFAGSRCEILDAERPAVLHCDLHAELESGEPNCVGETGQ